MKIIPLLLLILFISGCGYVEQKDKVACLYGQADVKKTKEEFIMKNLSEESCEIQSVSDNLNAMIVIAKCGEKEKSMVIASTTIAFIAKQDSLIKCQQVPNNQYWEETLPEAEKGTYWELK